MIKAEFAPAAVPLHMAAGDDKDWGEDWDEIERNVVREVLPNEKVAALVTLVASSHGGFIDGANLRVDGGYVVGVA